jgi:hypothetical protein
MAAHFQFRGSGSADKKSSFAPRSGRDTEGFIHKNRTAFEQILDTEGKQVLHSSKIIFQ